VAAAEAPPEVRLEFCTSGREALRAAAKEPADLWLINTRLRDMPGFELCDLLKSRSPDTVVYLVTDQYQASEERAAWLHGAALFRPKPAQASWLERFTNRPPAPADVGRWKSVASERAPDAVPGH